MLGMLVAGSTDFAQRGGCAVPRVIEDACAGCEFEGERAIFADVAIDALCATGWPSTTLCARPPKCGDGSCSSGETSAGCSVDCAVPKCGDGVCNLDENDVDCDEDCLQPAPGVPPASWTCRPEFYGTADGCDRGCGAPDPDCDTKDSGVTESNARDACADAECRSDAQADAMPTATDGAAPGATPRVVPGGGCSLRARVRGGSDGLDALVMAALAGSQLRRRRSKTRTRLPVGRWAGIGVREGAGGSEVTERCPK